jgi:hypothetical protein
MQRLFFMRRLLPRGRRPSKRIGAGQASPTVRIPMLMKGDTPMSA